LLGGRAVLSRSEGDEENYREKFCISNFVVAIMSNYSHPLNTYTYTQIYNNTRIELLTINLARILSKCAKN
jgi:hypothetical protein